MNALKAVGGTMPADFHAYPGPSSRGFSRGVRQLWLVNCETMHLGPITTPLEPTP
jgi:hypothetical protein